MTDGADNIAKTALLESTPKDKAESREASEDAKDEERLRRERAQAEQMREEEYFSARQGRRFRNWAFMLVVPFSLVPLWMLLKLTSVLFSGNAMRNFFMSEHIGASPKVALITGTIIAFLVVFGFLARGAFNHRREKPSDNTEGESPPGLPDAMVEWVRRKLR